MLTCDTGPAMRCGPHSDGEGFHRLRGRIGLVVASDESRRLRGRVVPLPGLADSEPVGEGEVLATVVVDELRHNKQTLHAAELSRTTTQVVSDRGEAAQQRALAWPRGGASSGKRQPAPTLQ